MKDSRKGRCVNDSIEQGKIKVWMIKKKKINGRSGSIQTYKYKSVFALKIFKKKGFIVSIIKEKTKYIVLLIGYNLLIYNL